MNLTGDEFDRIRKFLYEFSGLSLAHDKQYLVHARLEPILERHRLDSFGQLIARLEQRMDGLFRDEVVEAMTTNETSFNRDGHPYEELRRTLLPELLQKLTERRDRSGIPFPRVRIWSVACSTGQEPYSIAMTILDFLEHHATGQWTREHFWILATDLSQHALRAARAAVYADFELERGVTPEQRRKYFQQQGKNWLVASTIRHMVEYRQLNLLHNFSDLAGFDLIFCRNLLIYFDEPTRLAVGRRTAGSMNPGGYLIVGAAEPLPSGLDHLFRQKQCGRTIVFERLPVHLA